MITKINSLLQILAATNPDVKISVRCQVYTENLGIGMADAYDTPKALMASLPKEVKQAAISSIAAHECINKTIIKECRKNKKRVPKDAPKQIVLTIECDTILEE